jgi:hypothetical protein
MYSFTIINGNKIKLTYHESESLHQNLLIHSAEECEALDSSRLQTSGTQTTFDEPDTITSAKPSKGAMRSRTEALRRAVSASTSNGIDEDTATYIRLMEREERRARRKQKFGKETGATKETRDFWQQTHGQFA